MQTISSLIIALWKSCRSLAHYSGITISDNNRDVVKRSDVIFLCVKPLDVKGILHEVHDLLTPEKLLISIASGITIDDLRLLSHARVARIIPSVTSECRRGYLTGILWDKCHRRRIRNSSCRSWHTLASRLRRKRKISRC